MSSYCHYCLSNCLEKKRMARYLLLCHRHPFQMLIRYISFFLSVFVLTYDSNANTRTNTRTVRLLDID
jgi:hypothetical protein